jgi:Tfp pilus assembly protein PilW
MRRRKQGMTVIELMIAGILTLLVGAGTYALLTRAWNTHDALITQNMVQREARAALDMACDGLRDISPWNQDNVKAYRDVSGNTFMGSYSGLPEPFTIAHNLAAHKLLRATSRGVVASVSNILSFNVTYVARVPTTDGSAQWVRITDMNNNPTRRQYDARINRAAMVYVTVTAQYASPMTGVVYTSTLTSAVKIRNQFYSVVPPSG